MGADELVLGHCMRSRYDFKESSVGIQSLPHRFVDIKPMRPGSLYRRLVLGPLELDSVLQRVIVLVERLSTSFEYKIITFQLSADQ